VRNQKEEAAAVASAPEGDAPKERKEQTTSSRFWKLLQNTLNIKY
jgi:hypothetical protein